MMDPFNYDMYDLSDLTTTTPMSTVTVTTVDVRATLKQQQLEAQYAANRAEWDEAILESQARYEAQRRLIPVRTRDLAKAREVTAKTILRQVDDEKLTGVTRSHRGWLLVELNRLDPIVRARL